MDFPEGMTVEEFCVAQGLPADARFERVLHHVIGNMGLAYAMTVKACDLLTEKIERYETALRYIERPTMGLPGGVDPEQFARNEATDQNVRLALETCIRTARGALHGT